MKVLISTSASKKVQANAKLMLGKKALSILTKLESLNKEKLLDTSNLNTLLDFFKFATEEDVEKVASSAPGKKMVTTLKALGSAKTIEATLKALKSIRVSKFVKERASNVTRDKVKFQVNHGGLMRELTPTLLKSAIKEATYVYPYKGHNILLNDKGTKVGVTRKKVGSSLKRLSDSQVIVRLVK